MPRVLPRDVSAGGGDVAMRDRARVIATRPLETASGLVDFTSGLSLGVPNEWHQRAVGTEADEHMNVIREDRLREDMN